MSRIIWVIKDMETGNFVRRDCFKIIDGKNLYISYRTFSRECRGYNDKDCAVIAQNKLMEQSYVSIGFEVLEVNLEGLIRDHRDFVGENMVVVEVCDKLCKNG